MENITKRCLKVCYRSRSAAKKELKKLNKIHQGDRQRTDVYYCEPCDSYHITSMPKQLSRDLRRYRKKKNP